MDSNAWAQILVVEDNEDDSFLLTRELAKAQIEEHITIIGNGKDALDFLLMSKTPPIAILLDLKLPGLSGLELLERVRQEPRLQAVPVVIMTGSVNPNDVDACSQLGVTAYLPKPIGLTTFIKIIAHLFPKATVPQQP